MTLLAPPPAPAGRRPLPYPRPGETHSTTPGHVTPGRVSKRAPRHESPSIRRWPAVALFGVLVVGYTVVGTALSMRYGLMEGDGISRVANAAYVIFSRNPHLGAIGFVWNPLPSLVEIPILPLKYLWYPIQSYGVAGIIQSALFMAGSAVLVRRMALDLVVPTWSRRIVVAAFALNPMIIDFGANGMSEASMIFFAAWACRRLLLWFRTEHVADLSVAGLAFGVGYLSRYEMLASTASSAAAVIAVTAMRYRRAHPGVTQRRAVVSGLHNALILTFPTVLSFGGWALTSWLLTGQPFTQFSSQYGNSAQLSAQNVTSDSTRHITSWIMQAVISLAPMLPVVLVTAVFVSVRRRRLDVLAPVACLGGILAFEALAQVKGFTFGWFRFYICAVPLCCALYLTLWREFSFSAPVVWLTSRLSTSRLKLSSWRASGCGFALLACVIFAPSLPVTLNAMMNPQISNEFAQYGIRYVIGDKPRDEIAQAQFGALYEPRAIAQYIDNLDLPNGSVLLDTFLGFSIWLAATDSRRFVVTSDYDFISALNNPVGYHVQYFLVPARSGLGSLDAVNLRYPTLWDNGAGIATLVQSFTQEGGQPTWRLYKVIDP